MPQAAKVLAGYARSGKWRTSTTNPTQPNQQPMQNNTLTYVPITAEHAQALIHSTQPTPIAILTTKSFVDWALEHNTHNRNIKPAVVSHLADMINAGQWIATNQGIGFSRDGWLVDGQHRLEAIKACDYPALPMLVVFGMPPTAQLAVDFHAKRSAVNSLYLVSGISLNSTQGGTLTWLKAIETRKASAYLTPMEFKEYGEKYADAVTALSSSKKRRGLSSSFFAPLIYLLAHGEKLEDINAFIEGISTGIGLSKGDPRYKYRDDFIVNTSTMRRGGRYSAFIESACMYLAYVEGKRVIAFRQPELADVFDALQKRAELLSSSLINKE